MGDSNLFEFIKETNTSTYVRYGTGTYWVGEKNVLNNQTVEDTWFKVVIKVKPGFIFDYKLYNEAGDTLADIKNQDMQYVTNSEYFENVALIMTHGTFAAKTDIDYIKVWNMPTKISDNYATYTESYDAVTVSNIKVDGENIEDAAYVENGTVTFDSDGDVTVEKVSYTSLIGNKETTEVEDYEYANNQITFPNGLVEKAEYTIVLGLGHGDTQTIKFTSKWTDQIGLIYENDGTTGWNAGYDFISNETQKASIEYKTENETNYMHFVPSGTATNTDYLSTPMVYASLGDKKIKFQEGYTIVTEMMMRTTSTDATSGRPRIGYSFPENTSLKDFTYINDQSKGTTPQTQTDFRSNLCSEVLVEFLNAKVRFGVGTYPTPDNGYAVNNDKWYKIIIEIDGKHNVSYEVIDPANNDVIATYSGIRQIKPESGCFENIALYTWMKGGSLTEAYTDIDYIKVYNIPKGEEDNYEKYTAAYDETKISNIKVDGVDIKNADDVKTGTVTFDTAEGAEIKEVYYNLLKGDGEKTAVTDYTFANNTLTFTNGLVKYARYTIVVKLADLRDYTITFDSEWENQTGTILDLDGTETDSWKAVGSSTVEAKTDEDGTNYARVKISAINDYMYASLPDDGIKFKDGETVVIDTRIRGNGMSNKDARMQIKWNMPETKGTNFKLKYNGTLDLTGAASVSGDTENGFTVDYTSGYNHLALGEIAKTTSSAWVRCANGTYDALGNMRQSNWKPSKALDGNNIDGKWFRFVIKINKGYNTEYIVYNEAGEEIYNQTGTLGWVEQSGFLKNISFYSFSGSGGDANKMDSIDVDYLKVYNEYKVDVKKEDVGENTVATCTVSNAKDLEAAGAVIYIAAYDSENRLVEVDSKAVTATETEVKVKKAANIKVFLWNGQLQPINY